MNKDTRKKFVKFQSLKVKNTIKNTLQKPKQKKEFTTISLHPPKIDYNIEKFETNNKKEEEEIEHANNNIKTFLNNIASQMTEDIDIKTYFNPKTINKFKEQIETSYIFNNSELNNESNINNDNNNNENNNNNEIYNSRRYGSR